MVRMTFLITLLAFYFMVGLGFESCKTLLGGHIFAACSKHDSFAPHQYLEVAMDIHALHVELFKPHLILVPFLIVNNLVTHPR